MSAHTPSRVRRALARVAVAGVLAAGLAIPVTAASPAQAATRVTYHLGTFNSYAACSAATRAKLTQLGFYGTQRNYSSWCGAVTIRQGTWLTYQWLGGIWVEY